MSASALLTLMGVWVAVLVVLGPYGVSAINNHLIRKCGISNEIPLKRTTYGVHRNTYRFCGKPIGSVLKTPLDEEHPQRELRLGFDGSMRLLEIVVLIWDDGTETIIHSMKARKQYRALLD